MSQGKERVLSSETIQGHDQFHHLVVDGKSIPPIPYLYLPFQEQELIRAATAQRHSAFDRKNLYFITQAWYLRHDEAELLGSRSHFAIDYNVPYATPVAAPCDGWATSTYWSYYPVAGNLVESLPEKMVSPFQLQTRNQSSRKDNQYLSVLAIM
ncbi:MAG: hypothetical protein HYW33_01335 [Candidatus Blackburnbacteria bacterium]|nr:hypothetical protein [Candidatus Blackburnbacteria bacterium]